MRQVGRIIRTSTLSVAALSLLCLSCQSEPESTSHTGEEPAVNPWNNLNFNDNPANFTFAIVTDLTGRLRPNVFPDAVRKLNLLQPEFVMTIGDLIEGHTNDAAQLNREWDAFFKAVESLEMPIFYTPGNHDYWYETTQGSGGKHEVYDMADVYKERVGRPFYHFVYKDVLFLVLNNNLPENSSEVAAQEKYIKKVLDENADVRWTFTFFHWSRGFQGRLEQVWQYLGPLVANRKFTAFGGNSHQYVKYDYHGRDLINLGTTGGMSGMRGAEFGEFDHIVWVTMTDSEPRIANLELSGIHDKNVRTVKSKAAMSSLLAEGPVRSEPILIETDEFSGAKSQLTLVNQGDARLFVRGRFRPHTDVVPVPGVFEAEIAAQSSGRIDLELVTDSPVPVVDVAPLELDWVAAYRLPGPDPDVEVTGKHRLVIDVAGNAPRPAWAIFSERFNGRLNPVWIPLGPGGSFNSEDEFTLTDNPPPLEGERKDSEGRFTDGPLYETAVHSPVEGRTYRYTDGRGIYTMTPLFHLPVNGIYRDLPAGTFETQLTVTDIQWEGDRPELRWEFWDDPDRLYNYGPSYLSGVVVRLYRQDTNYYLGLHTASRLNLVDLRAASIRDQVEHRYTDTEIRQLAQIELDRAPTSITLRANWRESTRTWDLFYKVDEDSEMTIIANEFVEDIRPSPDGKRNLIYVRQAKEDGSLEDLKGGFSVVLRDYRLLH